MRLPFALGLVLVAPAVALHAQAEVTFMDLPFGPLDVSADGSVVVGAAPPGMPVEAVRWTKAGGMVGLGFLPNDSSSDADGVSADGSVVVGYSAAPDPYGGFLREAFRWTEAGGMVGLGFLPNGDSSVAYGVSADGSVVVGSSGTDLPSEAFRWTEAGGMVGLGPGRLASDVSSDGSVVVTPSFLWTEAGGMVDLPPPAGSSSSANAVSADGSVVVGTLCTGSSEFAPCEAARWTQAIGWVRLGLAGYNGSGLDVSADGSVAVGTAGGGGAMIWDRTHGARLLQDVLVHEYGIDLTGWFLEFASAISADGRTVVGFGPFSDGGSAQWKGWMVTGLAVPEPDAALLALTSIACLAALSRRCSPVVST